MNRRISIATALLLAAVWAAGGTHAAFGQRAEAYVTADSVTVGDRFGLVVLAGHDDDRTSLFPHDMIPDSIATGSAFGLGDFEILGVRSEGSRPWPDGGVIDSVVYETTTFALDTALVANIPVRLVAAGDTLLAASNGIMLPVTSLVPADAQDIRDIKPLAEFPRVWWPWIVGVLVLAAVAAALWYYRRKTMAGAAEGGFVEPPIPPYEEAMQRLHDLERLDVELEANVKPYYIELSDLLRTYLGRRIHVKALEATTGELISSLERKSSDEGIPDSVVDETREILDQADLVKFADLNPVWETNRHVKTLTRSAIERAERALREQEQEKLRRAAERARDERPDDDSGAGPRAEALELAESSDEPAISDAPPASPPDDPYAPGSRS
jgi:hypothetical protein